MRKSKSKLVRFADLQTLAHQLGVMVEQRGKRPRFNGKTYESYKDGLTALKKLGDQSKVKRQDSGLGSGRTPAPKDEWGSLFVCVVVNHTKHKTEVESFYVLEEAQQYLIGMMVQARENDEIVLVHLYQKVQTASHGY